MRSGMFCLFCQPTSDEFVTIGLDHTLKKQLCPVLVGSLESPSLRGEDYLLRRLCDLFELTDMECHPSESMLCAWRPCGLKIG